MAASTVTLESDGSKVILAADEYRDKVVLQLLSKETTYLAFGEDAADVTGLALINIGDVVVITGVKARVAINGYSAATPTIGIETNADIVYLPGPYIA